MNLSLENVSVTVNGRSILKNVSAFFRTDSLHCIIGQNGSGKTTLLKAIMCLMEFEGRITLESPGYTHQSILSLTPQKRARHIAYLAQNPGIAFEVTVEEFVRFGRFPYLDFWGNYSAQDMEIVGHSLEEMNLGNFKSRKIHTLSGGEFQRACLARALTQQAEILLLDEPSAALDPKQKENLYLTLQSLSEKGKLILCVSHDETFFRESSVNVWGVKNGEWAYQGKGGEIMHLLHELVY
ncbi:MAG: ABC transporter ATP-binding protein [Bacteroidia bacterium]|nr:ABC transporter ATP-binding protein [Bacteroidia bacterium]